MKKITLFILALGTIFAGFSQVTQNFSATGQDDGPTVITINNTDVTVNGGNPITLITLNNFSGVTSSYGSNYCGDWYSFDLSVTGGTSDGLSLTASCSEDFEGLDVTNFTTLEFSSNDEDNYTDSITIDVELSVTFTAITPPNCDSSLTSSTADFPIDGTLTWSAATGIPTGYKITMGSTTGGTDIANNVDLGTTISYTPTGLAYSTTYYTTITPYNANGDATGCTEQSFLVEDAPPAGTDCANPLDVGTLPYTAIAQTTAGFGDDYSGSPGSTGCTTTSAYLNGDDIVYSYTSDEDGSIDVDLTNITDTYTGIFIYSDCADIGTTCATGDFNNYSSGTLDLNITNFPVLNGTTYYIVVSTWASPQDTTYDLSVTKGATCLPVTGLTIDSFTAEEVQVSWTASSSGESNWEVLVQADGTGSPTSGTASATNPYTESGLTELTAYEVYVRADCGGGDYGDWVGPVDFTTSALCPDVSDITIDSFTADSVTVSWTNGGTEDDWEVLVQADGTGSPASGTATTTNPYTEAGLTELTAYEVYVRADCNDASNGYSEWVGPIDFTTTALCPDVSDITIDSFTAESVTVSWTNGGTEDDWEVLVQADGTGSPTSGTATATNPYTESGLTGNTAYEVYIRANCSDAINGYSEWVGPIDFTTACAAIVPDYTADMSTNVPDTCWNEAGDGEVATGPAGLGSSAWDDGNTYTQGSSNAINIYGTTAQREWLLSPTFNLSTGGPYQLEVNVAVSNWNDGFTADAMGADDEVQLLSSTDGGTTWVNLTTWNTGNEPTLEGTDYTEDLTSYSGDVQFAIWASNGTTSGTDYDFHVGKFVVRAIPTCPDLTGLTIDSFAAETAEISWTAGGSETDWEVLVQADGTGSPELGTPSTTSSNPYSATGLTELTAYEVYVRADCGGTYGAWLGPVDFTTTALCPDVTDITIDSFTADSVTVSWTNGGSEDDWEVLVQADGTGSPTSGTATTTNPYTESGLTGNTAYEVYVRADCSDAINGYSEWVGPIDFTTACATYTPDYTEDFTTFLDACWNEATGGDLTAGPSTLDTGAWTADGFANSGATGAARINYFGAGPDVDWLLSPTFDLSADGYELVFDSSIVDWNGTALTDTFNTGDTVQLVYSTDGTNWLVLYDLITNTPAAAGETIIVDLTGITSSTVQFAIFTDDDTTNTSGRDLDIFIDNFTVRTPWTCTQAVIDGVPTVNEDCGAGTFTIDIDFTAVGDATGITDGTDTFAISGTSVIAGPYTIGTIVNLEVIHAEGTCDFTITGDFTDNCPPANDDFSNAIAISCGDTVFGNTAEATLDEDDAPDGPNSDMDAPNLWYSFYGTGQDILLDTCLDGTYYDTEILVYAGTSGNLSYVAEGYDDCTGTNSNWLAQATFTAEAGIQYWISVGGYNSSSTGLFEMSITCTGTESFVYDGGTWIPSNPVGTTTLNDIVIFAGDAVMTGDTDCNSFTILPGAGVTIPTGATVTTAVAMTLESSSTSYSSLILDGTVSGTINYKRHVNSNASGSTGDNDLISAPLTGQAFNTFVTENPNIYNNGTLYAFGPFEKVTNSYVTWAGTETSTLNAGVGYRAASSDNDTFTFTGVANSGTVPITIESSGASYADWNLVGNPYPSYITLADFLAENNSLFSDSTSGVYGYDGNASDGWEIWNQAYSDANDNALITPGQGFFVSSKNATGTLNFTNPMRSTGTTDDFIVGRSNNNNISYLRLKATNSTKAYHTDFYFNDSATLGLDPGYDSGIFGSAGEFTLYSHLVEDNTGKAIGVQTINNTNLGSEVIIPLGVNATQGQQLTFTIAESTLSSSVNLYLEDNVANTSTLLNSNDYVLTPNTDLNGTGRFYLRFSNSTLSTLDNTLDLLSIYSNKSDKTIVISGQLTEGTTAKIYDIQGRVVMTSLLENTSRTQSINVSKLNAGVYVVQLSNGSQNKTQKVIIH
ncbi:fibronectin type III domain-containing protein [Winogradskyella psychrotolerans]|uniref:fibronectin type III domain-containing protein n=1 Tax=Winogradskyella psychrotolerans TaxID=1344585 RepID=UPI001C06B685|nr:fibronectin type III domain-containing protein [Winogradskyella psychrotolerans]MBU2927594.1 fibronectin type III domain-containing protein [Winogradskyella psychrotolerans]